MAEELESQTIMELLHDRMLKNMHDKSCLNSCLGCMMSLAQYGLLQLLISHVVFSHFPSLLSHDVSCVCL